MKACLPEFSCSRAKVDVAMTYGISLAKYIVHIRAGCDWWHILITT